MATLVPAAADTLEAWGDLGRARAALARGAARIPLEGLWGSAASLALAALLAPDHPAVVAVADEPTALRVLDDLRAFAGTLGRKAPGEVVLLPILHAALWRDAGAREEDAGRAGILGRLLRQEPLSAIVPTRGLEAPLPTPRTFQRQVLALAVGDVVDRDALVEHLHTAGYERTETVTEVGQWALRGGIVDIFSPAGSLPIRVELSGDDVESLRTFDPTTQRSTGSVAALLVLPMLAGASDEDARLAEYLPAEAPVAVADPALLAPGAPEAAALATLGERRRVDCGVLLTGDLDAFRLETRSIEGLRGQLRRLEGPLAAWRAEGFRVRLLAPDPQTADRLQEILRDLEHAAPIVPDLLGPDP